MLLPAQLALVDVGLRFHMDVLLTPSLVHVDHRVAEHSTLLCQLDHARQARTGSEQARLGLANVTTVPLGGVLRKETCDPCFKIKGQRFIITLPAKCCNSTCA